MTQFEGRNDTEVKKQLTRSVHVVWSRSRCWHGEKVLISVHTDQVPDETTVELKILQKVGQVEIDAIPDLKIEQSKLDHTYTIDWKEKGLAADKNEFVVKAILKGGLESDPSPPLTVDLTPPLLSC